jgi:hypothetical protein
MLMPKKHIRLSESIIGLAGFLLPYLKEKRTIDFLWKEVKNANVTHTLPATHSFDNLVLAIDFLYMIGAIICDSEGGLQLETYQTAFQ